MSDPDLAEKIQERVLAVVREVLAIEGNLADLDRPIARDIAVHSIDRISLFMALEDEFDQTISEAEVEQLTTLRDVVEFVIRKTAPHSSK